jgi:hypothetical protein
VRQRFLGWLALDAGCPMVLAYQEEKSQRAVGVKYFTGGEDPSDMISFVTSNGRGYVMEVNAVNVGQRLRAPILSHDDGYDASQASPGAFMALWGLSAKILLWEVEKHVLATGQLADKGWWGEHNILPKQKRMDVYRWLTKWLDARLRIADALISVGLDKSPASTSLQLLATLTKGPKAREKYFAEAYEELGLDLKNDGTLEPLVQLREATETWLLLPFKRAKGAGLKSFDAGTKMLCTGGNMRTFWSSIRRVFPNFGLASLACLPMLQRVFVRVACGDLACAAEEVALMSPSAQQAPPIASVPAPPLVPSGGEAVLPF